MGKILEAFLNEQLHVDGGTEERSLEQQKICESFLYTLNRSRD